MNLKNILEGMRDHDNRMKAMKLFDDVMSVVHQEMDAVNIGKTSLYIKGRRTRKLPDDLLFSIEFGNFPKIDGSFMTSRAQSVIELNIPADVNDRSFNALEELMLREDEIRAAFIHEAIHYFDRQRVGDETFKKVGGEDKTKDAFEQNALFQQVASEIDPRDAAMLGINEFAKKFMKLMAQHASVGEYFSEDQMRNLKKRIAQLYNDLKNS